MTGSEKKAQAFPLQKTCAEITIGDCQQEQSREVVGSLHCSPWFQRLKTKSLMSELYFILSFYVNTKTQNKVFRRSICSGKM
jgi:hypothetical protein